MVNIVELKQVEKIYQGNVNTQVLFNINLAFEEGSFTSIVGQSGSGKSTLMNIIGTLDKPTNGEVYIDSKRTDTLKKGELAELRNKTIGFVFQFHYLLPEFTAIENVLIPYRINAKEPKKNVKQRADELFNLFGISKVMNNKATKMSGGQQQRTSIVRALVNQPKVILADEPTGNLDSDNTENIYRIFRQINQQFGTTFIVVTHDRRLADEADRIIEIRDGRIATDIVK